MMAMHAAWMMGVGALFLGSPAAAQRQPASEAEARESVAIPAPWVTQDPGDSLYGAARNALTSGDYRTAVRQFRALRDRYPRSAYVGDAHYWEAYALSKLGSKEELRSALALLDTQASKYPGSRTIRDARELRVRIQGQLAQLGDAASAAAVAEAAAPLAPPPVGAAPPAGVRAPAVRPPSVRAPRVAVGIGRGAGSGCSEEDDERLIALNALLQMRAEQALPILQQVLQRRDSGSVCLRRQAVFLVSQKRSPETAAILLSAARGDPDADVRENAVFWLSQVNSPEAVAALDSILQHATDPDLQKKAVYALSQQRVEAAGQALRAHLQRPGVSEDVKEDIIFWLGQRKSQENAQYLKDFYAKTSSQALKEKVLFSISQMGLEDNARWLIGIAQDENESIEVRKNALFWAGQMRQVPLSDLTGMYKRVQNSEMKKQLLFVYSQRHESEAVDELMDIARTETDRDLRKNAIFWLSQSHDPRVAQFLLEIINK
jgi:HEAT repeat protein